MGEISTDINEASLILLRDDREKKGSPQILAAIFKLA